MFYRGLCRRPNCKGAIFDDGEELRCCLCGRPPIIVPLPFATKDWPATLT